MAYIRKTDSGNYEAFIDMGKDPGTGKRQRTTKTFSTKKEAKTWVSKKTQFIDSNSIMSFCMTIRT